MIEIDEDARRSDATQSLFSVLQGRLALIASYDKSNNKSANVFHFSIGVYNLKNKKDFLGKTPDLGQFKRIVPDEPNWLLSPKSGYPKELWSKCIPLTNKSGSAIFKSKCSALKLAPTAALFHTSKPTLIRRSSELSGKHKALNMEEAIKKWFDGQRKPPSIKKFTDDVKKALSNIDQNTDIKQYLFRPFTPGWVIENDNLFSTLSSAPGGGTRTRPEIRKAFSDKALGIAIAPAPADLGATLTRFACFSWNLPDNDIAARGNAMIYCNIFPEKNKKGYRPSTSNFQDDFLKYFDFSSDSETQAMYYVYAILSSSAYLDTFEGVLYRPSDPSNPPRIPLTALEEDRIYICNLGKKIAECEKSDFQIDDLTEYQVKYPDKFKGFQLSKYTYDEKTHTLFLSSKKESIRILGVHSEVVSLSIAGHNVVDKWIRERTYSYLRREFGESDIDQLLNLLSAIKSQNDYIDQVDQRLMGILTAGKVITIDQLSE